VWWSQGGGANRARFDGYQGQARHALRSQSGGQRQRCSETFSSARLVPKAFREADIRAKPVLAEFDRIIGKAMALIAANSVPTSIAPPG
jgi:hypothetical protein